MLAGGRPLRGQPVVRSKLSKRAALESDMRRDDDAPEGSGVGPRPAEGVGCGRAGETDADRVLVIDVEPRCAEELVVQEVQGIATQGQAHAFVELESLLDARVDLVERFCARDVAADRAGKGVPTAECINRKGVVDDEMNGRGTDQRAGWRSHLRGTLASADVDQLVCGEVAARGVKGSAGIAEYGAARIERAPDKVVVEGRIAVGVAVVGVLYRSDGNTGLVTMCATELPAPQNAADEALLILPREIVDHVGGENVRIGLCRDAAFAAIGIKGVLSDGGGDAAGAGEDLAGVVQRLAKGIREIGGQIVEGPDFEFVLQAIIFGPSAVVARANQSEVAICAPNRGS